ncbi:hypothetical protein GX50_06060 [[Emmonsia] crescens]|uniref:Uncharacterized protein n=1 Tax=[Emmonsia] crescens TaxID=73230 RepID=A0A2B7ZCS7_9EURO|nr:hypothetical protein GX50_06060 [Emmonsia crescens]
MFSSDAINELNFSAKCQLASVLYSNITVNSQTCDPQTGRKLSPALLSSRRMTWNKLCSLHKNLKSDLIEHLLSLIKCEVGDRIDTYDKQHKSLKKQLVNDLQQLNNMWMKDKIFAKKYVYRTEKWLYQNNQCDACIVVRVAQNRAALENLRTFLVTRAPPRQVPPPRLLFWVTMFLNCHDDKVSPADGEKCKLSRSKSMPHTQSRRPPTEPAPEHQPKTDWTAEATATIERWQLLSGSTAATTSESRPAYDPDGYTRTKITRSLTLGRMEDHKRPSRAHQPLRRDLYNDKSNSNINGRDQGRGHGHGNHNTSDHGTSNQPRKLDEELFSPSCNQRGNSPYRNSEILRSRRHSVVSVSSNYSGSPPTTPAIEQSTVGINRYNDVLFSPAPSVSRTATAAGIAASEPIGGRTGYYSSNGNFDTDHEPEPDLEPQPDTDIDIDINSGRDRARANDFTGSDGTKVTLELEDDPLETPEDSDSEWDDDSVHDSDERHSHSYASDSDSHGCDIANQEPLNFYSIELDPVYEFGGLAPPKGAAS